MIKLGIDARRAFNDYTGLGNYSRNLISILSRSDFSCYLFGVNNSTLQFDYEKERIKIVEPPRYLDERIWKQLSIYSSVKRNKIDIYHGLTNEIPYLLPSNVASIVTIHDLLFLDYPQHYTRKYRNYYNVRFKHGAKCSDRVIAMSTKTKQTIIKNYGVSEDKVDVILQGCNSVFKKQFTESERQEIRARYKLPTKYILFVGSVQERKNILAILKAIKGTNIQFVVVSNRHTKYYDIVKAFIKDNQLEKSVHFRTVESNTDLAVIYQLSQSFVFPSIDEGFGIPILEALYGNVPVIANDIEVFREVGDKYCYYCDMKDSMQTREVIQQVGKDRRIPNADSLPQFLQQYDDENILNQYINVYNKVLLK
nr:glycosyltransferase family 1 protein [uncultured Carboxylicivirga sp.]